MENSNSACSGIVLKIIYISLQMILSQASKSANQQFNILNYNYLVWSGKSVGNNNN